MKKNIVKLLVLAIAVMSVMLAFASCGCSHEAETIPAVEATCTKEGATAGSKCKLCGEILEAPVPVEKIAHDYQNAKEEAPTCDKDGATAGVKCTVCGDVQSGCEPIPAAHKPTDVAEQKATCTTDGVGAGTRCTVCGEDLSGFEVLPALDHDLVDVEEHAPTCTVAGSAAGKQCSRCDYFEGLDTLPATGHTGEQVGKIDPTCDTDGCEAGVRCKICKEAMEGCAPIPMLGHKPGEITIVTEPTLGVPGKGTSTCTVCNKPLEVEIKALPGNVWNYDCENVEDIGVTVALGGMETKLEKTDDRTFVTYSYGAGLNGEWNLFFEAADLETLTKENKFVFTTDMKLNAIVPTDTYAASSNPWFMYTGISDVNVRSDNDHLISTWMYWKETNAINLGKAEDANLLPYNEWFKFTIVTYLSDKKVEGTEWDIVNVEFYVNDVLVKTQEVNNCKNDKTAAKIDDTIKAFQLKFKNKSNFTEFSMSLDNTKFEQLKRETVEPEDPKPEDTKNAVWDYEGTEPGLLLAGTTTSINTEMKNEGDRTFVTYSYGEGLSGEWQLFFVAPGLGQLTADEYMVFETDIRLNDLTPTASYAANASSWFMYTGITDSTDTAGDHNHIVNTWYVNAAEAGTTVHLNKKDSALVAPYQEWFTLKITAIRNAENAEKIDFVYYLNGVEWYTVSVDDYIKPEKAGTNNIPDELEGGRFLNDDVVGFKMKFKSKGNFTSHSISFDNTKVYTEEYVAPADPAPAA